MIKNTMISRLAMLSEADPVWGKIEALLINGVDRDEDEMWFKMKEISEKVKLDSSWLRKLEVHRRCGHEFAGRRRYRLDEVEQYLTSSDCIERIGQLRNARYAPKGEEAVT